MTVRVVGNSPRSGDYCFPAGVTLGHVFDAIGAQPRDQFRPSHSLCVRRWYEVKPHSIVFYLATHAAWREFQLRDKDLVIYQYDVAESAAVGHAEEQ